MTQPGEKKQTTILIVFLIGLVISVIGNVPALAMMKYASMEDWGYFNALSLFVRSCILNYKTILLYDPWSGAGTDVWMNPEHRILSPMCLLDILFPPQLANILSLIVYGMFGFAGCYCLLKYLRISFKVNILCSALFVNAQWFGLHYAAGHIPFGGFLLIPWVLLSIMRIHEKKFMFLFVSLCALFLLDGGFYPFIFSIFLFICCFILGLVQYGKIFNPGFLKSNWWFFLLLGIVFFLIVSARIATVLFSETMTWDGENILIPFFSFLSVFFNPIGTPLDFASFSEYKFHEFGTYIGSAMVVIIAVYLINKKHLKKSIRFLLAALLFFWIGTGLGTPINPWVLMQKIPLINVAHIQSRYFMLMYLFLIIVSAFALQKLRIKNINLFHIVALFLLLESFFVRIYPMYKVYDNAAKNNFPVLTQSIIANTTLTETVGDGIKPFHYLTGKGHLRVYERLLTPTYATSSDTESYRGEIYFMQPDIRGSVRYREVIPGRITFEYHIEDRNQLPVFIEMNLNYNAGWKIVSGENVSFNNPHQNALINLVVHQTDGTVILEYAPRYLAPVLIAYFSGLIMWIAVCAVFLFRERLIKFMNRRFFRKAG